MARFHDPLYDLMETSHKHIAVKSQPVYFYGALLTGAVNISGKILFGSRYHIIITEHTISQD